MSTKLWGCSCFLIKDHVWFIGCVFYTPCPSCAFLMLCLCIAHSHLLLTPLLPLPCLGLYLVSTFLSCHVYLMLYSIVFLRCFFFCLSFIFSFILYPLCILSLFISSFLSLLPLYPFVYLWQKGGEYIREYQRVLSFLYDSCAHSQGEKFYFLCTFVGGKILKRDAYTKGKKIFL